MADTGPRADGHALVLDPRAGRTGYAVFKASELFDFGTVRPTRLGHAFRQRMVGAAVGMMDRYSPRILILPRVGPSATRRSRDAQAMIHATANEATRRGILVVLVSWPETQRWYQQATGAEELPTKRHVHNLLVQLFPLLRSYQPRTRRYNRMVFENESYNLPMFEAVAMYATWARVGIREEGQSRTARKEQSEGLL